jgi:hypothetical protein
MSGTKRDENAVGVGGRGAEATADLRPAVGPLTDAPSRGSWAS